MTMEPGVAIDLHQDVPGPPRMVCSREGCCSEGRSIPITVITASVPATEYLDLTDATAMYGQGILQPVQRGVS